MDSKCLRLDSINNCTVSYVILIYDCGETKDIIA